MKVTALATATPEHVTATAKGTRSTDEEYGTPEVETPIRYYSRHFLAMTGR